MLKTYEELIIMVLFKHYLRLRISGKNWRVIKSQGGNAGFRSAIIHLKSINHFADRINLFG
jgi:hypothetical protein